MDLGASPVCRPRISRRNRGSTAVMGGRMGREWGRATPWLGAWAWQSKGKLDRRRARHGGEASVCFIVMLDEMRLSWRENPMLVLMNGLGCQGVVMLDRPPAIRGLLEGTRHHCGGLISFGGSCDGVCCSWKSRSYPINTGGRTHHGLPAPELRIERQDGPGRREG